MKPAPRLESSPQARIAIAVAFLLGAGACATAPAHAPVAPPAEIQKSPGPQQSRPTPFEPRLDPVSGCVNTLDQQTERDLALLKDREAGRVPTVSGLAVLSFPQSKKDLAAWNHLAVAAVRIYSADPRELPIDSVLLATDEQTPRIHRLPFIFPLSPVKEIPHHSPWFGKTGPYVQTVYTFVPLRLVTGAKAELSVRLAGRMTPLPLLKLPLPKKALPRGLRSEKLSTLREDERRLPEPEPILAALARDFCLGR